MEFDGERVSFLGSGTPESPEREMTVAELANKMIGFGLMPGMLEGHGSNAQPTSPPPYMAGIAEVEVDEETGLVRVVDYAAVVDCGTVINPALARVQAEGGIAQGIGMALTEDVSRDEKGRLRTGSFMTYKLPTRLDVPEPRVEFMPKLRAHGPLRGQVHRRGRHQHAVPRGHERGCPRDRPLRARPADHPEQGARLRVARRHGRQGPGSPRSR